MEDREIMLTQEGYKKLVEEVTSKNFWNRLIIMLFQVV